MTPEAAFVFFVALAAAFGLAYFPVLNRLTRGFVSPYAKADLKKRTAAAAIDVGLVVMCVVGFRIQGSVMFLLAAVLYLLLRDALLVPGQSVGKFLMGLIVVNLDQGRPCSRVAAAKRNAIFIVPGLNVVAACLEAATLVRDPQGQRLGDRIANTQVVEGLGAKELVKGVQKAMQELEFERHREEQPVEVK
jgi:uncharacterized RDD family membrane protein YckC